MENKKKKKILEIYTIFEQKLKICENKKKKNDFDKIIKLEQIHKSKIIYGKVVSIDEGLDINKIIEDNNNLKEKIFEIKDPKIKKERIKTSIMKLKKMKIKKMK